MITYKKSLALCAMISVLGGCGAPAVKEMKLPEGESNLSCAAVIFAATNLVAEGSRLTDKDASFADYIVAMTKYGTAHATAEGLDANDVLNVIKIEAYKMTGKVPGRDVVLSDEGALKRAKACYGG